MERIYSAFFTSDRRRSDVELTAEALAKHDEATRAKLLSGGSDAASADAQNGAANANALDAERSRAIADILEPSARSFTNNSAVVVVGDDLSALDVDPTVGKPTTNGDASADELVRHRDELGRLVKQQYAVRGELVGAARAAARAFLLAYGAKAFTALLLASRKWGASEYGGYADAVRLLLRVDTIRFGAFFGSLVGVFRLTELAARLARGGTKDATNLAIAGGVSGLALLVDSEDRRSTIALYVFVRMLDVVGRHLTAIGTIPSWEYSSECLFATSNIAIMYAFIVDPTLLPRSYYNWILQMGGVTHHGLDYVVRQGWRGETDALGNPIGFRGCQPHYHVESCVTHSMKEWVGGLGRAIQIYLPVHFLPAIFFKFPRLQSAPLSTSAKITYAALCSSAFLTSYQTIVKLVVCTMRNTFQHDYIVESCLGGVFTGASLFFEDPKRRFELMLYCVPRAIDIIWQLLKRRGFVRYVKHAEVALFCLSMSLIMSRPPEHFKPTYLRILRFLFGRNTI